MKNFALFLLLLTCMGWSQNKTYRPNLKFLYDTVNDFSSQERIENDALVLKDYHLLVSSGTWWPASEQAEIMWEKLAQERLRELNVIVVYDAPKQDALKIKTKSPRTKMYEFFDQGRRLYDWFSQKTLMDSVLIGPNGQILYQGLLNSQEKINYIKSLVKKKEF